MDSTRTQVGSTKTVALTLWLSHCWSLAPCSLDGKFSEFVAVDKILLDLFPFLKGVHPFSQTPATHWSLSTCYPQPSCPIQHTLTSSCHLESRLPVSWAYPQASTTWLFISTIHTVPASVSPFSVPLTISISIYRTTHPAALRSPLILPISSASTANPSAVSLSCSSNKHNTPVLWCRWPRTGPGTDSV